MPVPDKETGGGGGQIKPQSGLAWWHQTQPREDDNPGPDAQAFDAGDAVDAVHEIEQVDEPDPAQADADQRHGRGNGIRQPARQGRVQGQDPGDRRDMACEPQPRRHAAEIVDQGNRGQAQGRQGEGDQRIAAQP